ncbi:type II secretion system secretin GspD [Sorangium sp. So ce185]|uniref:type II secretion system secretin GspD n=1 Tax=Sorangium sp. So ce185 TaxID=3133287 RepID=UPI003F637CAC
MVMTTLERSCCLRRRLLAAPVAALVFAAAAPPAAAQPANRNAPVLRTPGQGAPAPGRPGIPSGTPAAGGAAAPGAGAPGAGAPGAPGAGAPGAPGAAPGDTGDDPLAAVKQGVQEIEFKPKPGGYKVSFNLDEADLPELVKAISNITGRRFIYGGKLRQIKATVYAPEKVTVAEAYSAFLSILASNDLTVIPHGRFLKIVETPGAVSETTPVFGTAAPVPAEDRFVTRMYRLSHIDANEAGGVLTKFKSKDGDVTVYPPGNLLIITDTGTNIQRMLRIVEEIDVGGAGDQLWVQPVHYGSAAEVATKLNEIVDPRAGGGGGRPGRGGAPGAGGTGARIIADDRTNSLIITASEPDYLRVLGILKRLDVPQTGEGQVHVLSLQHAGCKELSATLNQVLGGSAGGGGGAAVGGRGAARNAPPVPGSTDDIFEGQVKVTCDEASNKLLITSSPHDYAQLRTVIDQLDEPRRQVFIEAVIMDVDVKRSLNFGIGYHAGAPFDAANGQGIIYGGNNVVPSVGGLPTELGALALGVRGAEIPGSSNIFGTGLSIPAFGIVLHALAQDGDSNILATPHILATDNVAAEISIGQNIPLQTNVGGGGLNQLASLAGGAAGAAGALGGLGGLGGLLGGLGGQAARQDVGTKIKVIPHVNDSDQVRLELTEEISDAGAPLGALGAIPINKRTASTTLVVRDQQTVVIGGLVRDSMQTRETKIPVLGDIPVLGFLFRQRVKEVAKTNLLLVLTPYVIRDQEDLRAIFERKMQERQEFIDRYFVFSDSAAWEPPRDFSRANGLVEDIRQSILTEEERARLEEEARPRRPQDHTPVEPVGLPTFGGKAGAAAGPMAPGMVEMDGDMPPPQNGAPPPPRPVRRPPGGRQMERVE